MAFATFKRFFVGRPKSTAESEHQHLNKRTALAVFSSDALSSTAYATEEILLVLAAAVMFGQGHAFSYVIPISIGIAILLLIVATSYRQTIHAYPSGGGAYIVAKENLGTNPGLVAGGALLVDYVLTVSVSVAAGVAAITSAVQGTQFAWLDEHRVLLCIIFIAFYRAGEPAWVRESGALFSLPTYAFLVVFLFMIGFGLVQYLTGGSTPAIVQNEHLAVAEGYSIQPLTLFLLLGAFSNGCAALTGIEAISNGVPAFKAPAARNASITLIIMAVLLITMFLGTSVMAYLYGFIPRENETVISQFARLMFTGSFGWFYYAVQAATAAILVLAANTAFADFPLASLLARDRVLPRQFASRGDRLVFSNGIILLAVFSCILVTVFGGDTSRLIPLYAVGVFLSFTLSQSGMVRHWLKERSAARTRTDASPSDDNHTSPADLQIAVEKSRPSAFVTDEVTSASHWKSSIIINGVGAIATFIVLWVFIITKFVHGAWIVVVIIPILVLIFRGIHRHYSRVAAQLTVTDLPPLRPIKHTVVVPISGIHKGVIQALEYAMSIAADNVTAVYVDLDEEATVKMRRQWDEWGIDVPLVILDSPYRSLTGPLLRFIHRVDMRWDDDVVTVVLPEFIRRAGGSTLLHNQSSLMLKGALLFKRGITVTSIPYHLEH